jgi:hypothetical protein
MTSTTDNDSGFGDADPEDAWDPDDPVVELLDNLRRRIVAILLLRAVDERLHQRLEMLRDDLAHILERVRVGELESRHG